MTEHDVVSSLEALEIEDSLQTEVDARNEQIAQLRELAMAEGMFDPASPVAKEGIKVIRFDRMAEARREQNHIRSQHRREEFLRSKRWESFQ